MDFLNGANSYFDQVAKNQGQGEQFVTITDPNNTVDIDYNRNLFYKKLQEQGILLDEILPILEQRGHMAVVSCAGAGKTTVMVLKLLYNYVTGVYLKPNYYLHTDGVQYVNYLQKRILVSTFLSSGATDVREKYREWATVLGVAIDSMANIKFSTIDAEVRATLRAFNMRPTIIEDSEIQAMIKSLMLQHDVRAVGAYSPVPNADEMRDVTSIIGYARSVLDGKRYTHPLMSEYNLDSLVLDTMIAKFKQLKQSVEKMDFADLQETLYEGLQGNQAVVDVIMQRYDMIIIDEFQDTSQLQYAIFLYYFAGNTEVITVGDDDQTIYSWRGSDIDIILERFPVDMRPMVHMITTNYRCRANILNAVIPSITQNKKRFAKELKAHKQGGELNLLYTKDVEKVVNEIKKDVVGGNTVGLLTRVNMDLLLPSILLELDGTLPYRVSKGVNLRSGVAKQVLGLMDLITKRHTPDFGTHFKNLLPRKSWHEASQLHQVLSMNTEKSIYNIPERDIGGMLLYTNVIKKLRIFIAAGEEVAAYLFLLNYLRTEIYTKDSRYHVTARDFITFIETLIMEHPKVNTLSMEGLDRLFNQTLPTKIDQRMRYDADVNITLTTVHEAKGKEWESVYIWNDVEGTFPTHLNRELTDDEMEEERRVHYIAWTRAKDKLTVITQKGRESIFLKECDLSSVGVTFEQPSPTKVQVFSKPNSHSNVTKSSYQILTEYQEHINCLELDAEEYRHYNVVMTNFGFEETADLIEKEYGVELLVKDDYEQQKVMQSIMARIVDNIYSGKYTE